jgi:hypothetical protein
MKTGCEGPFGNPAVYFGSGPPEPLVESVERLYLMSINLFFGVARPAEFLINANRSS